MKKAIVGNRRAFEVLQRAFTLSRMREQAIVAELSLKIKQIREYKRSYSSGAYDYLESYPCGYGDAFEEKVNQLYFEFECLKMAYKLSKGDATLALNAFTCMTEG